MKNKTTELAEFECKVIRTIADCDIKLATAAKVLYVHRNTLTYYVDKIKRKTGLDVRNFYDLCKLLEIVEGLTA